jgi:trk system potassium uptake protein TrkH
VVGVNAGVVLALGLALLVPLALSLLYRDGSWASFLVPAAFMIPLGQSACRASRLREVGFVLERDVFFAVTLAWTLAAVLGGEPLPAGGHVRQPLDSAFEGMSGFTTTGATLLADIEAETPSILFWRSMTQWLGGIGIVVLFVAVAPAMGAGAARLLGAGGLGAHPSQADGAHRRHRQGLLVVYFSISVAEVIALLAVGMPPTTRWSTPSPPWPPGASAPRPPR